MRSSQRRNRPKQCQLRVGDPPGDRRRWRVPRLLLAAGLALATWLLPGPTGLAHICVPDPELGVGGALLFPSASGLARVELPDRATRAIPILPSSGVANHVARSPDGSRLAVARFSRPESDPVGGSDVLITGFDGGAPQVTIARQRPGEMLGAPAWVPDAGLVYEQSAITSGPVGARLWRVESDGSNPRLLAERAAAPAISPDGQLLAFVRSEGSDRLLVRSLEGGPERVLLDDPSFLALAFPRFSPDGQWIALSAVTDEPPAVPTPDPFRISFGPFGVSVARAHGLPWDIWLIRADGTGLRRLTFYYDDDPAAAWSPDGQWLAVFAGESIKAISPVGPGSYCVLGSGGFGGFEWVE